jgi:hypothetical protein
VSKTDAALESSLRKARNKILRNRVRVGTRDLTRPRNDPPSGVILSSFRQNQPRADHQIIPIRAAVLPATVRCIALTRWSRR